MSTLSRRPSRTVRVGGLGVAGLLLLATVGVSSPVAQAADDDVLSAGDPLPGDNLTVVEVSVANAAEANQLIDLGLDVVAVEDGHAEIFLHSQADADVLTEAGVAATVIDHDRSAQATQLAEVREEEEAAEQRLESSPQLASDLPSGRVSYRVLDDVEQELKELAQTYPDRVKLFELPHKSLLGRTVYGIEISRDVDEDNGKPVFLNTGVHHAREWPHADMTLEFARDVLENDGTDPRITSVMDNSRMIVVPVVNPDGYDMSRSLIQEQKRKNCRVEHGEIPTYEECADPDNFSRGVDLNRNYAAWWGGPGASGSINSSNHYGEAPFSEPTIQNMAELAAEHQITVAINNHTPDARLLRTPASPLEPEVLADEEPYDALAQQLGAALDWLAGPWTEIYYFASGVAEQNAYYTAGTFAFTTEATPGHSGLARFHPPFEYVIDQYFGQGFYEGSSIREAWLQAWEAAADPSQHSVINGRARPGTELTVSKDVTVDTSPVDQPGVGTVIMPFDTHFESTLTVPASGEFSWHVNPSLRPSQYVAQHILEHWTVTCSTRSGKVVQEVDVAVGRDQSAEIDMKRCPAVPKRPDHSRGR